MKTELAVSNLKCGGCANTIKKRVEAIEGVDSVEVIEENSTIKLNFNSNLTLDKVRDTLRKLGYPTVDQENTILLKGKSYVSCAIGRLS